MISANLALKPLTEPQTQRPHPLLKRVQLRIWTLTVNKVAFAVHLAIGDASYFFFTRLNQTLPLNITQRAKNSLRFWSLIFN